MIDPEQEVYGLVVDAVEADFPDAFVTSQDVSTDVSLPALQFIMADSKVDKKRIETRRREHAAVCTFEAQAFSATSHTETRALIEAVDKCLSSLGFWRTYYARIPDADPSIRRAVATWTGTVFYDGRVGR